MSNQADWIKLAMTLIEVGAPLAIAKMEEREGRSIDTMTIDEALAGLRKIKIRSVEELEEEGRLLAAADKVEGEDDGA